MPTNLKKPLLNCPRIPAYPIGIRLTCRECHAAWNISKADVEKDDEVCMRVKKNGDYKVYMYCPCCGANTKHTTKANLEK